MSRRLLALRYNAIVRNAREGNMSLQTYTIEGVEYAANSLAQARIAHAKAQEGKPSRLEQDAHKARTQPYYRDGRA